MALHSLFKTIVLIIKYLFIVTGIISSSWGIYQNASSKQTKSFWTKDIVSCKFPVIQSSLNSNTPTNDEYQCTKCGKVYRWKKSLNLHLRVECGKEPQFQCPLCPYKAKQKGNLKSHMKVWHSENVQVL